MISQNASIIAATPALVRWEKAFLEKEVLRHNQAKNITVLLQLELVGWQIGYHEETTN